MKTFLLLKFLKMVKNVIGDDVNIVKKESNDNRSYHISSKKFIMN